MRLTMTLGCVTLLMACEATDEALVLQEMRAPLKVLGQEVIEQQDPELTAAFRDVAAIWKAGINE